MRASEMHSSLALAKMHSTYNSELSMKTYSNLNVTEQLLCSQNVSKRLRIEEQLAIFCEFFLAMFVSVFKLHPKYLASSALGTSVPVDRIIFFGIVAGASF